VVIDALAEPTAAAAATVPDRRGAAATNGYHLLVADREHAEVIVDDGQALVHHPLSPGVHVITQSSYGAGEDVRAERLRARLAARLRDEGPPDLAFWRAELSLHDDEAPMDATCIHMPQLGYGTRSSTYLRLGRDPAADAVWHADGRPCEVPYRDHTAQWAALRRIPGG
jgi:hypothetical protein